MKNINVITKVLTKILEVGHWVAVGLMAAVAICCIAAPDWIKYFMDTAALAKEAEISVYGFELAAAAGEEIPVKALCLFAVGSVSIFSFMAMVFRNLYLIIKKSEGSTPFQPDNVRMFREIGIFSISIPVVGLIMSLIIRLVMGPDIVELSVKPDGFIMGIIVLCLTQLFARGVQLEKDVDGLL